MTINYLYAESEELTSNFLKINHEDFISKSKELSLKAFDLVEKISFPSEYNPEFSTIIARSIVFLNDNQKSLIVSKIIKVLLNKSSIKLQRSYGGIISAIMNSLVNLDFLKEINHIELEKNIAYDYEYIKAVRIINQKRKEISS